MRATATLGIAALGLGRMVAAFLARGAAPPSVEGVSPLPRGEARRSPQPVHDWEEPRATMQIRALQAGASGGDPEGAATSVASQPTAPSTRREALDGDDLPPAPSALPPDPQGPYGSKYAGLYPCDLELRQRELQRKQWEVAEPFFEERFRTGRYRVTGPFPRHPPRSSLRTDGYPPELRPLVQTREIALDEHHHQLLVVEIHPHESPELEALRAEELWLQARIDELEAAW